MGTIHFIALGIDIAVLFTKFYKLGKINVMLDEVDAFINNMEAYNKAMKVEQKEAEEFLDKVQKHRLQQRKSTWFDIYFFTILAFGILFEGIYA